MIIQVKEDKHKTLTEICEDSVRETHINFLMLNPNNSATCKIRGSLLSAL